VTDPVATSGPTLSVEELTFDRVAGLHHETSYDEVAHHFAGPMSKHPVISVKGHPELIWVRPDMGIGMVANPLTFAIGSPARQISWRDVKRSLKRGYLPIVISTWIDGPLAYTQTAFACLIRSRQVRSGHEKQVVIVEISIANIDSKRNNFQSVWSFVREPIPVKGIPPFPYNTYDCFEVTGDLPRIQDNPVEPDDDVIRDGAVELGIYSSDTAVVAYDNVLRFEMNLPPGESRRVRWMVSSSALGLGASEISALRKLDLASVLGDRVAELDAIIESGTQIRVPEPIVNNIYKAQILNVQSQILQAADQDYCLPVQGYQGVWPWEAMKLTTPLDSIGHHRDAEKCLEYFLKVQGRFPPHGTAKSSKGTFGGTIAFEESGWEKDSRSTLYGQLARMNAGKEGQFPNWMNGTGAMLYAFATHYQFTKNREWLKRVAPALILAADWIISERQATIKEEDGSVLHFGLLPIGRAYDTAEEAIHRLKADGELPDGKINDRHAPLDTYYPAFTDSYSAQGLSAIAGALAEIGHADARRLLVESEAYREDIREVMRKTRTAEAGKPPFPERLYRPPAWAEFATGALAYIDSGFLDPRSPEFEQLETYMKKEWNRGILGLTGGMGRDGDPHGRNSFYVNFSEDIWHRGWLLRGEIEKALLAFYSMLAYGMDKQTLGTVERFHLSDPRYAPFFMDTSASARVCALIRQALLLEDGKTMHLLAGAPRKWFENDNEIELKRGITPGSKFDLHVKSSVDEAKVKVDLVFSELRVEETVNLRVRVPHPARETMTAVTVNGKPWTRFKPREETINLTPALGRTKIIAHF
jgi:hypothetical protein